MLTVWPSMAERFPTVHSRVKLIQKQTTGVMLNEFAYINSKESLGRDETPRQTIATKISQVHFNNNRKTKSLETRVKCSCTSHANLNQNVTMKDHQVLHHFRGNLDLVISQL